MPHRIDHDAIAGVVGLTRSAGAVFTDRRIPKAKNPSSAERSHATADRQHTLPLSPLLGIAAVAGGVILSIVGARHASS